MFANKCKTCWPCDGTRRPRPGDGSVGSGSTDRSESASASSSSSRRFETLNKCTNCNNEIAAAWHIYLSELQSDGVREDWELFEQPLLTNQSCGAVHSRTGFDNPCGFGICPGGFVQMVIGFSFARNLAGDLLASLYFRNQGPGCRALQIQNAIYGSVPVQDCKSAVTLPLTRVSSVNCTRWPATITVSPA